MNVINFKPFSTTNSSLDRFFDDFFNGSISSVMGSDFMNNMPAVNVKETDDAQIIEVAAPGLEREDFDITIDNRALRVSTNKHTENEEERNVYKRQEFNYYSFERTFKLPENTDQDKISASYENGILKLILPKKFQENISKKVIDVV